MSSLMNRTSRIPSLFDSFFNRPLFDDLVPYVDGRVTPKVTTARTDSGMDIIVEVPGYGHDDLDISILGNRLTISGKLDENSEFKTVTKEFTEVVSLPFKADYENVIANLDKGILHISVNSSPDDQPKKISIAKQLNQ